MKLLTLNASREFNWESNLYKIPIFSIYKENKKFLKPKIFELVMPHKQIRGEPGGSPRRYSDCSSNPYLHLLPQELSRMRGLVRSKVIGNHFNDIFLISTSGICGRKKFSISVPFTFSHITPRKNPNV